MEESTFHIKVTGKVQGVYYRQTCKSTAIHIGITGTVWNNPDGSVEIYATGTPYQVEQFIIWCKTGPARCKVATVEITDAAFDNFATFSIKK